VEHENGSLRMLDTYILFLSQSQLSQNLSGIVSSLNTIEMTLANDYINPVSALDLILESTARVIPAHHTNIVLHSRYTPSTFSHQKIYDQRNVFDGNNIYKSVITLNQPIVVEDVHMVPNWSNWDTPPNTRAWLGTPISNHNGFIGVLSLARTTFSPFTNNEKEMSLVFARYLGKLFEIAATQLKKRQMLEKKYELR